MRIAFAPTQSIFWQIFFNFCKSLAFKGAKAALTQTRMADGRKALLHSHCCRRLVCTLQVAGVNRMQGFLRRQRLGQLCGLPLALGVQGNVELALNAGVDIPSSFAMADGYDSSGLH